MATKTREPLYITSESYNTFILADDEDQAAAFNEAQQGPDHGDKLLFLRLDAERRLGPRRLRDQA